MENNVTKLTYAKKPTNLPFAPLIVSTALKEYQKNVIFFQLEMNKYIPKKHKSINMFHSAYWPIFFVSISILENKA